MLYTFDKVITFVLSLRSHLAILESLSITNLPNDDHMVVRSKYELRTIKLRCW